MPPHRRFASTLTAALLLMTACTTAEVVGGASQAGSVTTANLPSVTGTAIGTTSAESSSPAEPGPATTTSEVRAAGTVLAWGAGDRGELGNPEQSSSTVPKVVGSLRDITSIAGGVFTGYAIDEKGDLWSWGSGENGHLGTGSLDISWIPERVPGLTGVTKVATGGRVFALDDRGSVWVWGLAWSHGKTEEEIRESATPVRFPGLSDVVDIATGLSQAYALDSQGVVWSWAESSIGPEPSQDERTPAAVSGLPKLTAITAGVSHGFGLALDGTVWTWGPLLREDGSYEESTVQVPALNDVTAIAASHTIAYAVRADRTVWGWCAPVSPCEPHLRLSETPSQVAGLTDIVAIDVDGTGATGYAVSKDGLVWVWGRGGLGAIGHETDDIGIPVQVEGVSDAIDVAARNGGAYALVPS